MKRTLSTSDAAHYLKADENANWTWAGARALIEYLEALEEDTGEEMELDVVAIRCDFTEYPDALSAAKEYSPDIEDEDEALAYLQDNTTVIEFDGGVIIQQF